MVILRAHHGLCLSFYKGEGYSDDFVYNMNSLKLYLKTNPLVQIVDSCDDVCVYCPHNKNYVCESIENVSRYDHQVFELCGIKPNSIMRYSRFHQLVCDNILSVNKRGNVCGDCEWSKICIYNKEG